MTLRIYKKNENEFFKHLRLKFKFLSGCAESDGGFKKRDGVRGYCKARRRNCASE